MNCPSAMTCLLYAEGELAGSALRETEAHLVSCRDCRARVMALREEGALLGEVLRGQLHHLAHRRRPCRTRAASRSAFRSPWPR